MSLVSKLSIDARAEKMPRFTAPIHFEGPGAFKGYWTKVVGALLIAGVVAGPRAVDAQQSTSNLSPGSQCVTNFDNATDYFPVKSQVTTATGFTIKYYNNYKLVENTVTNETFALYQCGTPVPTGLTNGTKFFSVPVGQVATLETSDNSYIELLGQRGSIHALEYSQSVSSPCLQTLEANNSVVSVDQTNGTAAAAALAPVTAQFGAFSADPTTNTSISTDAEGEDTLGRIEWLKFYGAFYNLEDKANSLYDSAAANYNCSVQQAAKSQKNNLTVAWTVYQAPSQYNNNTASWSFADAPYKKSLTTGAGGTYYVNTSYPLWNSSDSFLEAIQNVDLLIDETFIATDYASVLSNYGLNDTNKNNYKFVQNNRVYREDGIQSSSGGVDWLESAIPESDAVLQDVISALAADKDGKSNLPISNYQRLWLRNVAVNESVKLSSAANCTNPSQPAVDKAQNCSASNGSASGSSSSGSGSSSGAGALMAGWTLMSAALAAVVFSIGF